MNSRFGDPHFSRLLHTSYGDINDMSRPEKEEEVLVIYDIADKSIRGRETIKMDDRLDEESKQMFFTFDEILRKVYTDTIGKTDFVLSVAKSPGDFSNLVNGLMKIIERELNNSFVQVIRKIEGIEMPKFYNKRKQEPDGSYKEYPSTIDGTLDLNKKYNNDSLRLGKFELGSIIKLVKVYIEELSNETRIPIDNLRELIKLTKELKDFRNESAHSNLVEEKDFLRFYNSYCNYIKQGYLSRILDCKDFAMGGRR